MWDNSFRMGTSPAIAPAFRRRRACFHGRHHHLGRSDSAYSANPNPGPRTVLSSAIVRQRAGCRLPKPHTAVLGPLPAG